MINKKEIEAEPLFATEEQKAKGLCHDSWVIITASSEEKQQVFYFNPSVDTEDYENFKEFVESEMDDFCCPGDDPQINKSIKDNYGTISGYTGKIENDYDEDSRKEFKTAVGQAAIMDFHKGGITKEKLPEILNSMKKDLEGLISQGASSAQDGSDFQSNPYKYYGVRRSDFV